MTWRRTEAPTFPRWTMTVLLSNNCGGSSHLSPAPVFAHSTYLAVPPHRTISGVRLCWELEEPKGPKGLGAREQRHAPDWVLADKDTLRLYRSSDVALQGYLAYKKLHFPGTLQ